MHFLYHHRTAGRGAEGNHIMALVKALEAAGHTVTIVSPTRVDPRQTAGHVPLDKGATRQRGIAGVWQWISKKAPQVLFELLELGYNFYAAVRLAAAFRREKPEAFYERYAFFLLFGVLIAKLFGVPVFLEVNEISGIQRARRQILVPVARWIERMIFSRADGVFVVSSFLRQEVIKRGGRPETVHLMPNAIDPKRFELNGSRGKVRRERGLDSSVVAGFVGWFDHWDRLDLLVDATAALRHTNPDFRLMLVGDGPIAADLRAQVERLSLTDTVILTGSVPHKEVPQYIDAMDICVLPDSNPYGSPMVLFEFMAMGKAVVAAEVLPVQDVVSHGHNGLLIPRADSSGICSTLQQLIDDPDYRAGLGQRSKEYVYQERTWQANAQRVADLARRAAGSRGRKQ